MSKSDLPCICEGNWRLLVNEYQHLFGRQYIDDHGGTFTFFGLVHSEDDYYFGMCGPGVPLRLLSCVGHIVSHGYTLIDENSERKSEAAIQDAAEARRSNEQEKVGQARGRARASIAEDRDRCSVE
jgi:hypothetical protein